MKKQKKYCIRPILTADPKLGEYRVPTGLTTIRGIDYYSKNQNPGFVKKQVTGIIKEAMRKFQERSEVMRGALTGADNILADFSRDFEQRHGPPPSLEMNRALLLTSTNNANNLVDAKPNFEDFQNNVSVQQVEDVTGGENLPGSGNSQTNGTEGSGILETHQSMSSDTDLGRRDGADTERNTVCGGQIDGGTLTSAEEGREHDEDLTLEYDHGSLSRGATNTESHGRNQVNLTQEN
jgi:hypothetical protein